MFNFLTYHSLDIREFSGLESQPGGVSVAMLLLVYHLIAAGLC